MLPWTCVENIASYADASAMYSYSLTDAALRLREEKINGVSRGDVLVHLALDTWRHCYLTVCNLSAVEFTPFCILAGPCMMGIVRGHIKNDPELDIYCHPSAVQKLRSQLFKCGYELGGVCGQEYRLTFEEDQFQKREYWQCLVLPRNLSVNINVIAAKDTPQEALSRSELQALRCSWNGREYVLPFAPLVLQGVSVLSPKIEKVLSAVIESLSWYYFHSPVPNPQCSTQRTSSNSDICGTECPNHVLLADVLLKKISTTDFLARSLVQHVATPLFAWQDALQAACKAAQPFHTDWHHHRLVQAIEHGEISDFLGFLSSLLRRMKMYRGSKISIENVSEYWGFVELLLDQRKVVHAHACYPMPPLIV